MEERQGKRPSAGTTGAPAGPLHVHTTDHDELHEWLQPIVSTDFQSEPLHRTFGVDLEAVSLGRIRLFQLRHEGLHIEAFGRSDYVLSVPRFLPVEFGPDGPGGVAPGLAQCSNPGDEFEMRAPEGSEMLGVVFQPGLLREWTRKANGGREVEEPQLEVVQRLDTREGAAWLRLVEFLWRELRSDSPLLRSPEVVRELEHALVAMLMVCNEASRTEPRRRGLIAPNRRATAVAAEEYIRAHLPEHLTLAGVAEAVGVSARTLSRTFHAYYGTSPMAYAKELRLALARTRILENGGRGVGRIAHECGFTHSGRFSADYQRAFGELPSEARRR
jgi:AraC-like DNA-binding protein